MKDEREHIDDAFKDAAEKQSFSIPDAFLKDLEARLEQNESKKRRRGLWWLVFLPLGICAFFYFSANTNNESSETKNRIDQKRTKMVIGNEDIIDSVFIAGPEKTENDSVPGDIAGRIDGKVLPSSSVVKEQTKAGGAIGEESPVISVQNTSSISKMNKVPKVKRYVSSSNENLTSKQLEAKVIEAQASAKVGFGKDQIISTDSSSLIGGDINSGGIIEVASVTIDTSMVGSTDSMETINDMDSAIEMNPMGNTTDLVHIDTLSQTDSTIDMKAKDSQVNTIENENKAKKWLHEIQLYAGMVNSSPLLGFAAENASEQMIANELSIWTSSYGIKYYASINYFDFGVGFGFLKNGEKVNYTPNSFNDFTIDSTYFVGFEIDSIYNNNQELIIDSIPVYSDTSYVISINDTNSFEGKNTFSWINIPLHFGYRFELGKYDFIPRIGLDLGFASATNIGTYAESPGGGFVQRTSNRFILSYSLQLEIRRSLNRFHVFVNPYFRSNVMPVISSDIQRRRYHSMGINAGIGFRLNP